MRTQDPSSIRTDFDMSLGDIESAFTASEASMPNDGVKKLIAEYLFVAAATLLEGFISDLFVGYINRKSDSFRKYLIGKLDIDSSDEYTRRALQHVEQSIPHLSVEKIRIILDPTGYNITFATTAKMKEAAGKWLTKADKPKFTKVTAQQCSIIDLIKAVRNYLAHRSQSADKTMQQALGASNLPVALQRGSRNVADVGAYLRATKDGQCRLALCIAEMRGLAARFCP